ncbi:MAG: NADH-quinone oxidoreductase subunit M [Verrucomicrobia bacterium]|nr:NADH-quinone oxidoreductase subunit M [Verrucomicrobiota bacterium]
MKSLLLFSLILIPLCAVLGMLLRLPPRRTALLAAGLNLIIGLLLPFLYHPSRDGEGPHFDFVGGFSVVPELDLKFLVGVDGLSIMMVLLAVVVTVCALWLAPPIAASGERGFYACLLLISAGVIGAFVSLDLFFFYAFHELALIPTFLLIGIWGHGDRQAAAWKITIYLALGSFVLLLGLIGLYLLVPAESRTFDLRKLYELAREGSIPGGSAQKWIFLLLLLGFGTLVSLFPFHTWAPNAYASAPAPAAMLHAGVLKKFGLYGLLRVAVPLLPAGAHYWTSLLLALLIGNILYVGLITIAQKRLDLMLGYSSVMHMGYIFLGIASLNSIGLSGAALMMFAHGLSIALLFAVVGQVRQRTGTLRMDELGGLAKTMPFLAVIFGFGMFASIGLPGFANFASEVLVFFGAFSTGGAHFGRLDRFQIATVCALWGVVISAVYMLRAYRRIFQGEPAVTDEKASSAVALTEPALSETAGARSVLPAALAPALRWPLILLLAGLLLVGFYPRRLLDMIAPSLPSSLVLPR